MSGSRRRAGSTGRMRCTPIQTTRQRTSFSAPTRRWCRGPRADLHDRAGQGVVRRCGRAARAARRRATLDGIVADMRGFWRSARHRQPAALARPGEGRRSTSPPPRSSTPSGICGRKVEGKPLWKLLVDLTPEQFVACVDFRYITDALAPEEALDLLRDARPRQRGQREAELARDGLSRVHDLGRLARLRRREGRVARPARRSPTGSRT